MGEEDKITSGAKAIEGIVKAVPIYQDALQPAVQQVGKGLETITKTIHIALAPISALVWGYDKIGDFLSLKLTEKLKKVPSERIITPNLLVAGPVVESLKFAAHDETLRELYANLLATAIDSETAQNAHPAFPLIIQNLSPDEAKILKYFAAVPEHPLIDIKQNLQPAGYFIKYRNFSIIGKSAECVFQELLPNYLDNLCRLGLLEIPSGVYIMDEEIYKELEGEDLPTQLRKQIEALPDSVIDFDRKKIQLTNLGDQFCQACVIDKDLQK